MHNKTLVLQLYEAARPDLEQSWCPHPAKTAGEGCLMNWLSYHATIVLGLRSGMMTISEAESQIELLKDAYAVFNKTLGERPGSFIGKWNDSHTHAEVMAAVDATIAALKGQTKEPVPPVLPDSLRNLVCGVSEKV